MRKLLSTALVVGVFASTSISPAFALSVDALPQFDRTNPGNQNVDVTYPGSGDIGMNVQVLGGKGSVGTAYWNNFNVGKNSHVNFEFTDHNQTSLNHVNQAGGLSEIYGRITNSGCDGCGYAGTGKVILLNPNGVLFGDGANVTLNSFTVSTMDGTYESLKSGEKLNGGNLTLRRGTPTDGSTDQITVLEGANIYGDKGLTFAAKNVGIYKGSKLSTNTKNNVGNEAYGKIKIVTADGVNFAYYNNGAVKNITDTVASNEDMRVRVEGYLESGNIDIRNYSNHADSFIAITKNAALKAVKAVKGNDGNIWLTANNKVTVDNSTLTTTNMEGASAESEKGSIKIHAGQNTSVLQSKLDSAGDINIISDNSNAIVDSSILNGNNIAIKADKIAEVQNNSKIDAKKTFTLEGKSSARILDSSVKASQANASSNGGEHGDVSIVNSKIDASNTTVVSNGSVNINKSLIAKNITEDSSEKASGIIIRANDDITSDSLAESTFKSSNITIESTAGSIKFDDLAAGIGKQFENYTPVKLKAAKNIEVDKAEGDLTVNSDWSFDAKENVSLKTQNGDIYFDQADVQTRDSGFKNASEIKISSSRDVLTQEGKKADFNNLKTTIDAKRDINIAAENVSSKANALTAHAGQDMTITTSGNLAVSELISKRNMTLTADKILSGEPKTQKGLERDGDSTNRAYIEVGGKFTTHTANGEDDFDVTRSHDYTDDGQYLKRHWIEFGEEGEEKILLVNDRPVPDNDDPANVPGLNGGEEVNPQDPGTAGGDVDPNPGPGKEPIEPDDPDAPDVPPSQGGDCDNPSNPDPDENVDEEQPAPGNAAAAAISRFNLKDAQAGNDDITKYTLIDTSNKKQ